eukprot:237460_1
MISLPNPPKYTIDNTNTHSDILNNNNNMNIYSSIIIDIIHIVCKIVMIQSTKTYNKMQKTQTQKTSGENAPSLINHISGTLSTKFSNKPTLMQSLSNKLANKPKKK